MSRERQNWQQTTTGLSRCSEDFTQMIDPQRDKAGLKYWAVSTEHPGLKKALSQRSYGSLASAKSLARKHRTRVNEM